MPPQPLDMLRILAHAALDLAGVRQVALALLGGAGALDEGDPLVGVAVEQRHQELGAGEVRRHLAQVHRIYPLVRFDRDFLHTFSCLRCVRAAEIPTQPSIYFPILAISGIPAHVPYEKQRTQVNVYSATQVVGFSRTSTCRYDWQR